MEVRLTDRLEAIQQTRDRELARVQGGKVGPLPKKFDSSVVGCTFTPHYPDNLHALESMWFQAEMTDEKLPAVIIRNPANIYDTNACEVHIPSLGEIGFVGHIVAPLAARLAPSIDQGDTWQGWVSHLKIHESHPERPGLEITLERIT